ncbi:TonB-dependent receptor [Turneriella parva]|uniref:TonB-dependent receptor plug n=1 Tax=Turneriella parva (strain ATCC BAA-1111 / DSM 21527 / NCTC 11395 / H) TaxID=869212 RepID=I4B7G9_TURPD|nr:carboxypeptidase-like regulatory domain-containing protein [Turneriella parva]AFM13226.1 TonB-dependent receptor plug [Turneriella parva DSM 21527]
MVKSTLGLLLAFFAIGSLSANPVTISGRVFNESTGEPLEFGTVVIPEAKFKSRINPDGTYAAAVPAAGEYTVQISSPGLKNLVEKIKFEKNLKRDFRLSLPITRTQTVKLRGERDIQSLSRNTLSVEQLKETPATFGDAINALATLPGVVRPGGFFGPLVIRGADDKGNRYFIDDIPVPNPQHFGGLQSIISNDLMREVDLYSSAFPSQFGGAVGAIIDIQTVDEVKEFGGVVDVSLISSNFLLRNKWGKNYGGEVRISSAAQQDEAAPNPLGVMPFKPQKSGPTGYWITSGRIGYLTLLVPPIYKLITGNTIDRLPEYYDYQLKGKVFLDDSGKHALTALVFGSYDTLKFTRNLTAEEKAKRREEGQDPILSNFNISNDVSSHSQGVYYEYLPSSKLQNKLIAYNSYTYSYFYADLGSTSTIGATDVKIYPNIFGIKDKVKFDWADYATLRLAAEYNLFYFKSNGQTQQQTGATATTGQPDLGNSSQFQTVPVNFNDQNHVISAYAENKFQFGPVRFVPGARSDFLARTNTATFDPRGLLSYEFPSETTISVAGGQYQSFAQVNTFYFNRVFNYQPQVVVADYLQPERSFHRTVGVEQKLGRHIIKVEGFMNDFDRLLQSEDVSTGRSFSNGGALRTRGAELFLRRDKEDKETEFYGWASYTYTQSERRRFGTWGRFENEQPHSFKLVAGFKFGANTIGAQFQLFAGFPYTQIVGGACTVPAYDCQTPETTRYSPQYSTDLYGQRFPASHRLDIRYTRKTAYKWGYFSWYIEVINIYNQQAPNQQRWNYNLPYSESNPKVAVADGAITIIPYFGLEWRF